MLTAVGVTAYMYATAGRADEIPPDAPMIIEVSETETVIEEPVTEETAEEQSLAKRFKFALSYALHGDASNIVAETETALAERSEAIEGLEQQLADREQQIADVELELTQTRESLRTSKDALTDLKTKLTACVLDAVGEEGK